MQYLSTATWASTKAKFPGRLYFRVAPKRCFDRDRDQGITSFHFFPKPNFACAGMDQDIEPLKGRPARYGYSCARCAQSKRKCIIREAGGPCQRYAVHLSNK